MTVTLSLFATSTCVILSNIFLVKKIFESKLRVTSTNNQLNIKKSIAIELRSQIRTSIVTSLAFVLAIMPRFLISEMVLWIPTYENMFLFEVCNFAFLFFASFNFLGVISRNKAFRTQFVQMLNEFLVQKICLNK